MMILPNGPGPEPDQRRPGPRMGDLVRPSTVCEEVELDDVRRLDVAMIEEALSRKSNLIIEI